MIKYSHIISQNMEKQKYTEYKNLEKSSSNFFKNIRDLLQNLKEKINGNNNNPKPHQNHIKTQVEKSEKFEFVSMQEYFSDDPILLEYAKKYQTTDKIKVVDKKLLNETLWTIDRKKWEVHIDRDAIRQKNHPIRNIIKNELAHILWTQMGFNENDLKIAFYQDVVIQWKQQKVPIYAHHLNELLSDFASVQPPQKEEIGRQILYAFAHSKVLKKWEIPKEYNYWYFYTNNIGKRALEKYLWNLDEYHKNIKRKIPETGLTPEKIESQLYEDLEKIIKTIDGKKMNGVEYFVYLKRKEGEKVLKNIIFNKNFQFIADTKFDPEEIYKLFPKTERPKPLPNIITNKREKESRKIQTHQKISDNQK